MFLFEFFGNFIGPVTPGGGRGYSIKFYTGRLRQEAKRHPFRAAPPRINHDRVTCEQAPRYGKSARKIRSVDWENAVYARLAPLAEFFSRSLKAFVSNLSAWTGVDLLFHILKAFPTTVGGINKDEI